MHSSLVSAASPGAHRLRPVDGLAFLPAALEIVETPPSPIGRAISLTLIAAFCFALAWASLGKVDLVASAQGKIVPSGRTKIVQPFKTGVVRAIHVRDGQQVEKGEVLIELDPTIDDAELGHLQSDLVAQQLEVARLRATLVEDGDPVASFRPPEGAPEALVATNRQLLLDQTAEQRAKLAALDRQRAQHEAEAALAAIIETRAQAAAEYRRTRLGELATAEAKAAGLAQDVVKASEKSRLQMLRAPVDGTVQQLTIHTVGGVVTPAQALLEVVPLDSRLEIEAMVPNHDVGFVRAGQQAEIKVDTFSFTKYGLLHGTVLNVSADSIDQRKPPTDPGNNSKPNTDSASEPQGHELVYAAHVSLDRTAMAIDGKDVPLSPGMAVTVEIKTGAQRVITYLMSPLLRFKQEALHER